MRLIDADAVLRSLPDDLPYKAAVKRVLIQAATVDAVPVVHERFVHDGQRFAGGVDWWQCGRCGGHVTDLERYHFYYCPWCGARMDGAKCH